MHHDPAAIDDTDEDRRWRRLLDASLGGEPLAPDDLAFLAAHRGDGEAARREREIFDELRRHGTDDATAADDAIVTAAVDRFLAATAAAPARPAHSRRRALVLGGLGGLALAAAAAALLFIGPKEHVLKNISQSAPLALAPPTAPPPLAEPVAPQPVSEDSIIALRLLRGDASAGPAPLTPDQPLADGSLHLDDAACVGARDLLTACAGGDVDLLVRGTTLALERGRLDVEIAPAAVGIVWIEVAGVAIVSDEPGAFLVVAEPRRWEITARSGALRLREGDVERALAPGETATSPELAPSPRPDTPATSPAKPRPASDPVQLLDAAHALRGAGNYRAAARIYRRLLREHGDTSLARTAQVALGQLSLGPLGDPRGALAAFDAYLRDAPRGALVEEALHGRVEALHRLNRRRDLADAAAEFLRRFPRSRYADDVRQRLAAG